MAPTAQAAPTCRAGTVPACFPAAHASGWACAVKPDADPSALGKAIEWVCGAGGTDCAQISGAPLARRAAPPHALLDVADRRVVAGHCEERA